MTTLRPCSSLWRRTRSTILAGTVALGTLLAPVGVAIAQGPDAVGTSGFTISVSDASELSGLTAQISTGGEGLNLRANPSIDADVVATLADGAIVNLRVDTVDTVQDASGTRWWPVELDGNIGWVSGFYLVDPTTGTTAAGSSGAPLFKGVEADVSGATTASTSARSDPFSWDGSSLTGATARVAANGDGLNFRAAPSRDGEIIASIPDGTVIDLRIDMTDTIYDADGITRWWPAFYNDTPGWVAGSYLIPAQGGSGDSQTTTGVAPSDTTPREQFAFDGGTLDHVQAVVSTNGDNLLLRAEPTTTSDILDRIPDGTVVDLRIENVDTVYDADGVTRWWPVTFNGQDGWVSGFYLADGADSSPAGSDGTSGSAVTTPQEREAFAWDGGELDGATAVVSANGDGANVRGEASADSDVVATVQDGTVVNLRIADVDSVLDGDGVTRWWPVEVDGVNGWISGFYLSDGSSGPASTQAGDTSGTVGNSEESSSAGSVAFPSGSTARVQTASGQGLRVHEAPGTGSEHIFSVAEGSTVTIVDGPVSYEDSANGWFEISANGSSGFVDGDLLALIATPEPTAAPVTSTSVPTESATTSEQVPQQRTDETPAPDQSGADTDSPLDDRPTETPEPDETATAEATQAPSDAAFIEPVDGAIRTQGFGCSSLGFYPYNPDWGCGVHDGIDFAAPAYTPVMASADGTVTAAGWCDCGLGYYVEIDHGDGVHTIYGHMAAQPYVSVGQQVSQGETIGPVGSTGLSTGPHTHFMVQVDGVSQDPSRYLP